MVGPFLTGLRQDTSETPPRQSQAVRHVLCSLAGPQSATLRPLDRKRGDDLFKTFCCNRRCFSAHTCVWRIVTLADFTCFTKVS